MRKFWISAAVVVLIVLLGGAAATHWAWRTLNTPLDIPAAGVFFDVESGTGLSTVTRRLEQRDIVDHGWLLSWYGRIRGDATRIKAGEYRLEAPLTAITLLEKLSAGDVYLHQFTIIEGWRFNDMLAALRAHTAIDAGTATGDEIMAALGKPGEHPEGQFLPDTYTFPRGTDELELLEWAHEALWRVLDEAWQSAEPTPELNTPYEGLILASIIEKETALESERALISGVFHERLRRGMRLQTDPTVIYGLGDAYDGNIRRVDLNTDTPYNTYTRSG
ncbi:MAG: endolytic transglycosylase MltG, partial [Gammaproteobacteria bacterium]